MTFEIDNNGILKVTAKDQGTGKDQSIVIQPSGGLTKDEINKMVNQAEQMKEQDKKRRVGNDYFRKSLMQEILWTTPFTMPRPLSMSTEARSLRNSEKNSSEPSRMRETT